MNLAYIIDEDALRITTVFSISPGSKINRKVLKEKTGLSNIILDKALFSLLNQGILKRERNLFFLNLENENTKTLLNLAYENYNKFKQLPLNEYFMILKIAMEMIKIKNIGDAYLFGSYSKLIFKEDSDIDIAVISDETDKKALDKAIKRLEKRYKKAVELHYFTKDFYKNKRDPLVKEILQNGIKLI